MKSINLSYIYAYNIDLEAKNSLDNFIEATNSKTIIYNTIDDKFNSSKKEALSDFIPKSENIDFENSIEFDKYLERNNEKSENNLLNTISPLVSVLNTTKFFSLAICIVSKLKQVKQISVSMFFETEQELYFNFL